MCDGTGRTAEIARSFNSSFKIIEFKRRLGKGGAIKEGFMTVSGTVFGFVDADGVVSSSEIVKIFRAVNSRTYVAVASPWVKGPS